MWILMTDDSCCQNPYLQKNATDVNFCLAFYS